MSNNSARIKKLFIFYPYKKQQLVKDNADNKKGAEKERKKERRKNKVEDADA